MTDTINYANSRALVTKPPLAMSVRWRLSVMMFLEFAVWGAWFMPFSAYCKDQLGFDGQQIGNLYGMMALGTMASMFIAGQLADRVMSSEYLMAIFHFAGAGFMYAMTRTHDYNTIWYLMLGYALVYNPTLAMANTLAFANIPDATRDFPTLRVLGTIGWIAANFAVDHLLPVGSASTSRPLLLCAGLSVALGLFSFVLPHTPPSGKRGDAIPFISAIKLLRQPDFGIFFAISFVITIALSFYYMNGVPFLKDAGFDNPTTKLTIGQWSELFFMLMLPLALGRFGIKWVLGIGMGAWAVRYGIFSFAHAKWLILLGVALHGVCFDFFLAAGFIYTDNTAPANIRSSAQSLFTFLTYGFGMYLGFEIGGFVLKRYTVNDVANWHIIWGIPAIGAMVCLLFFLLLWRGNNAKREA